jgi:FdhE protein
MAESAWQRRIRRAEDLAAQHTFASQVLTFYIAVARFQQDLSNRLGKSSAGVSPAVLRAPRPQPGQQDAAATNAELLASFPAFLSLVQKNAPERLKQAARELCQTPGTWSNLLDSAWSAAYLPSTPSEFLAQAFLQPYAEFVRNQTQLHLQSYTQAFCPFCSRKPALAVLRPLGEGARRNLVCGFCLCEWEFRRIVCPNCDEKDYAKLPVYTADEFPYIRVECCDACRTYVKSIDLSKNGLADPLVDELASIPLDLWARERGYSKLRPNLLGL